MCGLLHYKMWLPLLSVLIRNTLWTWLSFSKNIALILRLSWTYRDEKNERVVEKNTFMVSVYATDNCTFGTLAVGANKHKRPAVKFEARICLTFKQNTVSETVSKVKWVISLYINKPKKDSNAIQLPTVFTLNYRGSHLTQTFFLAPCIIICAECYFIRWQSSIELHNIYKYHDHISSLLKWKISWFGKKTFLTTK